MSTAPEFESPDNNKPDNGKPEPTGFRPFRWALAFSLLMTIAATLAAAWAWQQLPADAKVPMHWNAAGEIDGRGGRGSLFVFPGVILFMTLLFAGLPFIEPRRTHLLRSSRAYSAVWIAAVAFMSVLQGGIILAALGRHVPMDKLATVGAGIVFLVVGNYLGKVRSNFFFGVRTPWTLSSELAWNKTNRLAGRLFVLLGLAAIAAPLLGVSGALLTFGFLGALIATALVPIVYSYFVWRSDQNKTHVGS